MFKGVISVTNCYTLLTKLLRSCKVGLVSNNYSSIQQLNAIDEQVVFGVPLRDLLKKESRLGLGVPIAVESLIDSLSTEGSKKSMNSLYLLSDLVFFSLQKRYHFPFSTIA